eukprot:scaffold51410_cov36-Prasinocladus_malaysianus.AAC.4
MQCRLARAVSLQHLCSGVEEGFDNRLMASCRCQENGCAARVVHGVQQRRMAVQSHESLDSLEVTPRGC